MQRFAYALTVTAFLTGCAPLRLGPPGLAQDDTSMLSVSTRVDGRHTLALTKTPIRHVVLIVQENRTFNDFFATYPDADGSTTGEAMPNSACGINHEETVKLKESRLITRLHGKPQDLPHSYKRTTPHATAARWTASTSC